MCRSQANYCGNFNCSLKYSVRSILDLFQGIGTMFAQSPQIAIARVVLIFLGFLLVYLGVKGTLEPLIMVPMGLGMSAVNAGVLFLGENQIGNLIIDPLLSTTDELMTYMQINFLQPIYNLTFSNGLIACLVFMGIGILCDIGYVLEHPFISMTIALFAELGTVATYPIARAWGLTPVLRQPFPSLAAMLYISSRKESSIRRSASQAYLVCHLRRRLHRRLLQRQIRQHLFWIMLLARISAALSQRQS